MAPVWKKKIHISHCDINPPISFNINPPISEFSSSGNQNFIKELVEFDKDNMSDRVLKKIGQYCSQPDFQPDIIGRVSSAAKSLCMWVRAMEVYGRIYRVVEPKKQRLNNALSTLAEKQAILAEAKAKLKEVISSIPFYPLLMVVPWDLLVFPVPIIHIYIFLIFLLSWLFSIQ